MSEFIREVNEEVRRDRLISFFTRFQVPLALVIVAIIAGAGGWRWWMDQKLSASEAANLRYQQALDLAAAGKTPEADAAFDAIAKSGPAGYAMLSRMRAAEGLQTGEPEKAAEAFDAIANDEALPASMRDTARFRGALIRVDREDPAAFEARYGRFSSPGFAYHSSIEELLALTALKRGDAKAAERYLGDIVVDGGTPTALRNRAEAFRLLAASGAATALTSQPGPATVTPVAAAAPAPARPAPPPPAPAASPPAAAAPPAAK